MAYRLRKRESVTHGLRRAARRELKSASKELGGGRPPADEMIHEARKSVKKVRAVLELLAADSAHALNGSARRLRKVSHELSTVRDAAAMLKMLARLRRSYPRAFAGVFEPIKEQLAANKQDVMNKEQDRWPHLARALRKLSAEAKEWRPSHRGFRALAGGIAATHARGRKAMTRAQTRGRAADFHEWRKQIKALWYELQLLESASPEVRRDVSVLHDAETWLGDDHNVVVLCEKIGDPEVCADRMAFDRIRLAADAYQCRLRKRTVSAARRIYTTPTKQYVRGLRHAWTAWRS